MKKLATKLVERPHQETWWHGQDVIYPVPDYVDPTVSGSRIAVSLENLVYCLDAEFDYAKVWEFDLSTPIGLISSPRFWGREKVAVTALLVDGRYQGIVIDLKTERVSRRTLMKGTSYNPCYLFEDRYPVIPVVAGNDLFLITPYAHVFHKNSSRRMSLGRNLRIYFQPAVLGELIVFHMASADESWLEWRRVRTLETVCSTKKHEALYGITTGHVGTPPLPLPNQTVVCGFGDRLVRFAGDGEPLWEFRYPRVESLDSTEPLRVLSAEGETIYETMSEVAITSNLYPHSQHLYFVLSECTRHISYLTKMDIGTGEVVWTCRITGFSHGFAIAHVSPHRVLLQNRRCVWEVAQDGTVRSERELEIDCAACSNLVRVGDNKYVLLADLGVHEVAFKPAPSCAGSKAPAPPEHAFLNELQVIPRGPAGARRFQEAASGILSDALGSHLHSPQRQSRTVGGTAVRDLVSQNMRSSHPFWANLRDRHRNALVVFEMKNKADLGTSDLNQLAGYLGESMGFVGFLVCRTPPSQARHQQAFTIYNRDNQRRMILFLSDEDLRRMADMRSRGDDPTDVLADKYSEFLSKVQ